MRDKQKNKENNSKIYQFFHLKFVKKTTTIVIEIDHRFLTYSDTHFPPFWEPLGNHLGVLGDHLGGLERSVGSLVPSLGASLGHLGPSWVPLGYTLANFGPSKVILDPPQASFWSLWGPILDPSGQTIHHLVGIRKFQAINENLSSSTDQKGSKQTYLRSMQPSSQTII